MMQNTIVIMHKPIDRTVGSTSATVVGWSSGFRYIYWLRLTQITHGLGKNTKNSFSGINWFLYGM